VITGGVSRSVPELAGDHRSGVMAGAAALFDAAQATLSAALEPTSVIYGALKAKRLDAVLVGAMTERVGARCVCRWATSIGR
jgi:hypothetical protein